MLNKCTNRKQQYCLPSRGYYCTDSDRKYADGICDPNWKENDLEQKFKILYQV